MNQFQIQVRSTLLSVYEKLCIYKDTVLHSPYFKTGLIVAGFTILVFLAASITWAAKAMIMSEEGNTYTLPSDIYLASDYCREKMEKKLGDRLLRSYMDERSSREEAFIYRVFFKADVGTLTDWDEVTIYCYVDRWKMELAYFKEINPNIKQIKSTDLQFFK